MHSETSASPLKFLGKIVLFCVPLAVILGFPLYVLWRSGEMTPDGALAMRLASSTPVLVGLSYTNPVDYLALQTTLITKPEVVILGSSRSGQMRSNFFDPGVSVITAPQFQKISHFRAFLEQVPVDQSPKILMIGLDQKFFDPGYDSLAPDNIDQLLTQPTPLTDVLVNWSTVYSDYFSGKFTLADLAHPSSSEIGLWAIVRGAGYRNDGSHEPGDTAGDSPLNPSTVDYHYANTLSFVAQGIQGFEYSDGISAPALAELNKLLAECKARNIYVIGFVPPLAGPVYQKMESMPAQYAYLNEMTPSMAPIFKKYGFGFYNFSNPAPLGITDSLMTDGIHTTERGSLMLFLKMAETDPVLKHYASSTALMKKLADSTAQYDL